MMQFRYQRMSPRPLLKWWLLAVFFVAPVLVACSPSGGGNAPTSGAAEVPPPAPKSSPVPVPSSTPEKTTATTPEAPASATSEGEIKVNLEDNKFPEEIRVRAGAKLVFVITNASTENIHSFEFPDFGILKEIKPRETVRLEWTVPGRKGSWDMGCFLTEPTKEPHDGMEGTLVIE